MSDVYTLHREDDGTCYILEAGERHTPSGVVPDGVYEETVLQALVEMLNGRARSFCPAGRALEAAKEVGIPLDSLQLHYLREAYDLYLHMRRPNGLDGWRP